MKKDKNLVLQIHKFLLKMIKIFLNDPQKLLSKLNSKRQIFENVFIAVVFERRSPNIYFLTHRFVGGLNLICGLSITFIRLVRLLIDYVTVIPRFTLQLIQFTLIPRFKSQLIPKKKEK